MRVFKGNRANGGFDTHWMSLGDGMESKEITSVSLKVNSESVKRDEKQWRTRNNR